MVRMRRSLLGALNHDLYSSNPIIVGDMQRIIEKSEYWDHDMVLREREPSREIGASPLAPPRQFKPDEPVGSYGATGWECGVVVTPVDDFHWANR